MLRGMVFVDHQNFILSLHSYYRKMGLPYPKLDYAVLFRKITGLIDNVDFIKTSLYIPKPDEFLMGDTMLASQYRWAINLRTKPFMDVIEGRFIARPTKSWREMDINDRYSYYREEKGTDINLATDVITKAFHNAYDVAFVVSGDSDYLKVYDILRYLGKLTVVVVMAGQNIVRIRSNVDAVLELDKDFFDTCLLPSDETEVEEITEALDGAEEEHDASVSIDNAVE